MTKLIAAIQTAGGPTYDWRGIDPVDDQDGGAPGGNIRQVFLFRTDRGLAFVDRPGGTSTNSTGVTGTGLSTQLTFSPGRIDPTDSAFNNSRKPLAGEFTFNGRRIFVIANHFNSKGGDDPLMGHIQPPVRSSEVQRHQQAQIVHDFVADIVAANPNANVVVAGDLNDFEFSQTVAILKGSLLQDLIDTLPQNERYSYVFEGNSQTLDHILLSNALFASPRVFDVVHVNAEFFDQASDHDPSVVRIAIQAPATTITLDPANPDVNGWYVFAVKATVSATDHSGTGIAQTRCVLDPANPPASFYDLPAGPCPYLAPGAYITSEGVHTLYAGTLDNVGVTDLVSQTFKIDKTAPVSQVAPLPQFQTAATFTVSWSGTDNLSGVKDYDVRYLQAASNGTFGGYTTWFNDTTSTSASFTAPAGSTTCFSVKARDNAGWSPFAWSAEQCTSVPLDDPALTRIGFWSTVTGSGYYGAGVSRTTSSGASVSAAMRGQTIGVLVTKQPGGGNIQLRWNGSTKATVSLSAGSVQKQQLLTFTLPSVQSGTLEIVSSGFGTVDVDGAGAYKTS
jgi:hypothetical protein